MKEIVHQSSRLEKEVNDEGEQDEVEEKNEEENSIVKAVVSAREKYKNSDRPEDKEDFPSFILVKTFDQYDVYTMPYLITDVAKSFKTFMKKYENTRDGETAREFSEDFFSDVVCGMGVWEGEIKDIDEWQRFWQAVFNERKTNVFVELWNRFGRNLYDHNDHRVWINTKPYEPPKDPKSLKGSKARLA